MDSLTRYVISIVTICILLILFLLYSAKEPNNSFDYVGFILNKYTVQFPEIHFLHLNGMQDEKSVLSLKNDIGLLAKDMTYEHGDEARELLIDAQSSRISMMIEYDMPSATLFRTGENNKYNKDYVCVITFDREFFDNNPHSATEILVGDVILDDKSILKNSELNSKKFSIFTLHHEVFHCLDAYINGPTIRMTKTELDNSYELFRSEQRADFFASLVYRSAHVKQLGFLNKLVHFRTLAILDWDIPHFTAPVISKAISLKRDLFHGYNFFELSLVSSRLADDHVMTLSEFKKFITAAYHAAVNNQVYAAMLAPEFVELKDKKIDVVNVALLEKALSDARHAILN